MNPTKHARWLLLSLGTLLLALTLNVASVAAQPPADLSPTSATFVVAPGGSVTEKKTIGIPSRPPKADIEIAIDTTGSMGGSIAQAKSDALGIVNGVQSSVADSQFAIVQFRDFGDSPEYAVVQSMTASGGAVQSAINSLFPAGGGDAPEAYNLVFHNSYTPATGGDIGWRAGTRKFVIVIGDAQPHGNLGTQGLAGCSDVSPDPHGFVTTSELAGMDANQRTLFMILQTSTASTSLQCYQSIAARAYSGGQGVAGGTNLAAQIVSLINSAFTTVGTLQLQVISASPAPASASWISFSPTSLSDVPAPSTQTMNLTVHVPSGTPGGTYKFVIAALADGAEIGRQNLTIVTNRPPNCSNVKVDQALLWPPNHKLKTITVSGATDPDPGDAVTLVINSVTQDEPVNGLGDGDTSPDAILTSPRSNKVQLRAERSGTGNGRIYRLSITATDKQGASCTVTRTVGVPHDQGAGATPIDSAPPSYNSTQP